jgi:hypothetical protein
MADHSLDTSCYRGRSYPLATIFFNSGSNVASLLSLTGLDGIFNIEATFFFFLWLITVLALRRARTLPNATIGANVS